MFVKPEANVVYSPVRGSTRNTLRAAAGNGNPVSWLT